MADEQDPVAQSEPAEPTIAEEQEVQEQPQSLDNEAEGQEGQQEEDDLEDLEWEGKPIRAPKGMKDALLRHQDYTRKTQQLAESRKELEQRQERMLQQSRFGEEELQERSALQNVRARLQEYSQVDWDKLENEDPFGAQKHYRTMQELRGLEGQLAQRLDHRQGLKLQAAQEDFQRRAAETVQYGEKNIPGFNDELIGRVRKFAESEGITDQDMRHLMSPLFFRLLHRAMLGDELLKKPNATARPTSAPAKPLTTLRPGTGSQARKPVADMPIGDYVATRQAQIRKAG